MADYEIIIQTQGRREEMTKAGRALVYSISTMKNDLIEGQFGVKESQMSYLYGRLLNLFSCSTGQHSNLLDFKRFLNSLEIIVFFSMHIHKHQYNFIG